MRYFPLYRCPACGVRWDWVQVGMGRPACQTSREAWCGKCYENVKGRANHSGHRGWRPHAMRRESAELPLKKPVVGGRNGSASQPVSSQSKYLQEFSVLLEFLSSQSWEDSSKREPGTLSLTVTAGRWNGRVKDPNGKRYAYLTAATIDELLEAIELGLESDELDWREDKPFGKFK